MPTRGGLVRGFRIRGQRVTACEATFQSCLSQPLEDFDCDEASADEVPEDCNVTVGEMRTCFADQLAAETALLGQFAGRSCEALLMMSFEDLDTDPPASCAGIDTRCPGLFEPDDGGE